MRNNLNVLGHPNNEYSAMLWKNMCVCDLYMLMEVISKIYYVKEKFFKIRMWHMNVLSSVIHLCQKVEKSKGPPTDEWVNKTSIHTMKYYSAIKRNKVLLHPTMWMNVKNMLSERSQIQKAIYCRIPFIWNVQNRQMHRDRKYSSSCQGKGWRREEWGATAYWVQDFPLVWWK